MKQRDVVIVGGGAAGLMCALEAAKRGRSVLLLEHNDKIGEKIRISGGGRCNFTNFRAEAANYISNNPHFCKSALARYPSSSFIALVEKHGIQYHEKKLGQLFCDGSSQQIIDMLLKECKTFGVEIQTNVKVSNIRKGDKFAVNTSFDEIETHSLVVASGGLSIAKLGASPFGYRTAEQFGIEVIDPKPGLVPLTFNSSLQSAFATLSGISLDAEVTINGTAFRDSVLFTHHGISGPAILQCSSFWSKGDSISLNLLPDRDATEFLRGARESGRSTSTILEKVMPKRFVKKWFESQGWAFLKGQRSEKQLQEIGTQLNGWRIVPAGTEGFEKAEVTVGGIDTDELSSKTMEAKKVPGLYFIGEVVDVTGWLGGYNFQWAWSSGWVAGQYV